MPVGSHVVSSAFFQSSGKFGSRPTLPTFAPCGPIDESRLVWQSWQVIVEPQPTVVLTAAAPAAALAKPRVFIATSGESVPVRELCDQNTEAVGSGHSCVMVALVLSFTTTPSLPSHFEKPPTVPYVVVLWPETLSTNPWGVPKGPVWQSTHSAVPAASSGAISA